ncbi:MAG: aminotransferase class V-fold PLP-dependent enzyme [Candidatus Thermoplasmatota archaeon]|nr:aminotransferase class V-fold PLP-dependent enzyme [Candidatus Thermoplasmatota archaeon]
MLDTEAIRKDFPILQRDWGKRPPLVYLDSGCMTLKPRQVIEAIVEYYELHSACAGRSVHTRASQVSRRVDRSRTAVRKFIGASNSQEVVFLRNTTEGLNMVSRGLDLRKGDAVVLSDREHNSNLLPWLRLASRRGVIIRVVPSEDDGTFSTDALHEALAPGDVRVVSMAHTNNLDGYTIPIKAVAEIASILAHGYMRSRRGRRLPPDSGNRADDVAQVEESEVFTEKRLDGSGHRGLHSFTS